MFVVGFADTFMFPSLEVSLFGSLNAYPIRRQRTMESISQRHLAIVVALVSITILHAWLTR